MPLAACSFFLFLTSIGKTRFFGCTVDRNVETGAALPFGQNDKVMAHVDNLIETISEQKRAKLPTPSAP